MRLRLAPLLATTLTLAGLTTLFLQHQTYEQHPIAYLLRLQRTHSTATDRHTTSLLLGFDRGVPALHLLTGRPEYRQGPDPYRPGIPDGTQLELLTDFPLSRKTTEELTGPASWEFFGIGYVEGSDPTVGPARLRVRTLWLHPAVLPSLFFIFPFVFVVRSIWRDVRAANLRHRNHCPHCGYDLRSSPTRCPECGTPRPTPETLSTAPEK